MIWPFSKKNNSLEERCDTQKKIPDIDKLFSSYTESLPSQLDQYIAGVGIRYNDAMQGENPKLYGLSFFTPQQKIDGLPSNETSIVVILEDNIPQNVLSAFPETFKYVLTDTEFSVIYERKSNHPSELFATGQVASALRSDDN